MPTWRRRLNARLAPLWPLFPEFGGLRIVYAVANALGLVSAAPPRPILPLSGADLARVMTAVGAGGARLVPS